MGADCVIYGPVLIQHEADGFLLQGQLQIQKLPAPVSAQRLADVKIVGGLRDDIVKFLVQKQNAAKLLTVRRFPEPLHIFTQLFQLLSGDIPRRKIGGLRFQHQPEFTEVHIILQPDPAHLISRSAAFLQEPVLLQTDQGVPDRRSAHAEENRKLFLRNLLAGRKLPVQDFPEHQLIGKIRLIQKRLFL